MQKKKLLGLCLTAAVIGLSSCYRTSVQENEYMYFNSDAGECAGALGNREGCASETLSVDMGNSAVVFNKRVPAFNSLIVCRDKQCAPAELSKSKEYIFNALTQLVDNNLDSKALLCEANPQAHVCTNPYLTVPAKIGVTPAYVYFDSVKIIDASIEKGTSALKLVLGYNLSYNGQTPTVCKPDEAMLYVKNSNQVVLNGNGFKCEMTSMGTTTIRLMFNVDYIDLDYGYIGGYYSIGLAGPAYGGASGYGLIRLMKDAHPLSPALMRPEPEEAEKDVTPEPIVKPEINSDALKLDDEETEKALAPVEIRDSSEDEAETETYSDSARKPLDTQISFDNSDSQEYINPSQPVQLTSDSVVTSDGVIVKPTTGLMKPYEVRRVRSNPAFDEVYVDDLDEYIK